MIRHSRWKTMGAIFVLCAATAISLQAQTFTKLADFNSLDGAYPFYGPLAQGADGSLYGTTSTAGANNHGTVFKITAEGTLTILNNLEFGGCPDAGLILAADGNLYGTTTCGGANRQGTIFKMTPGGALTTLYSFCAQPNCTDGAQPVGGVIQGADGNFYGTASVGGSENNCNFLCGTVFKITAGGKLTTLYRFCSQTNCTDGANPYAGLVQGTDGNFYGTTETGGVGCSHPIPGCGTVFKITPEGNLTTLYRFGGSDGYMPISGLIQATDGNFYGTNGGGSYGYGEVYKLTPQGALTILHSFDIMDGNGPNGALLQATDGNLYGTTCVGGFNRGGTVFKINLGGTLTTLHSFNNTDGSFSQAAPVQGTNGSLYGTTSFGGAYSDGTVFSLDVHLGPFVAFVRSYGKVGQTGGILGQGFIGTTGVSLNGTPASFTVVSGTFIRATVPPGATTGYVTVTTPSGTLTSNVPFRVIK
jgi:uncharacterized repeat protein (TIGR03803 family)